MEIYDRKIQKQFLLYLLSNCLLSQVACHLQPYYLHYPPPPPLTPVPNELHSHFPQPIPWPENLPSNLATNRGANITGDLKPFILQSLVKPDTSSVTLQNGTVVYYVTAPWGGIRSDVPSSPVPPSQSTISNSILPESPLPTGYFAEVPQQHAGGGWQAPIIDITTPNAVPSRQQELPNAGVWSDGGTGFGWSTSTLLYDKLPEVPPTPTSPTRSRLVANITTTQTPTTTTASTTTSTTERVTPDPVAAATDERYPVSESVRKFRRIVAQIRAITKKELGTTVAPRSARRSQQRT